MPHKAPATTSPAPTKRRRIAVSLTLLALIALVIWVTWPRRPGEPGPGPALSELVAAIERGEAGAVARAK